MRVWEHPASRIALFALQVMLAGCQIPPQPSPAPLSDVQQHLNDLKTAVSGLNPGEALTDELSQLHSELMTVVPPEKDKNNIERCAEDADTNYGTIVQILENSSSSNDFDARMSAQFGAWANDPLVRLAVATRLLVADAILTAAPSSKLNKDVKDHLSAERKQLPQFVFDLLNFHLSKTPLAQMLESIKEAKGKPFQAFVDSPFSTVLIGYMRAYFDGKFVNRFGATLPKPSVSAQGIPDAAISGATTVLFEAVFDFLDRTPIVADQTWSPSAAAQPTFKKLWGSSIQSSATLPTALSPMKKTSDKKFVYGPVQTIASLQDDTPVSGKLICGVTDKEAHAIVTLSSYFGQRMVVWNGLAIESLSNFNVGFAVAGTSFAIGDNKTLVSIFKAAVEAIARRSAEQVLFRAFYAVPQSDFGDLLDFFDTMPTPTAKPTKS